MTIIYDAGVLVAAERNSRSVWAEHRVRLELGVVPITTAPIVAQVSRSPTQARLNQFLQGCLVAGFDAVDAAAVGALCGQAKTADVVDAHVVHIAATTDSAIITGNPADLSQIAGHVPGSVAIIGL